MGIGGGSGVRFGVIEALWGGDGRYGGGKGAMGRRKKALWGAWEGRGDVQLFRGWGMTGCLLRSVKAVGLYCLCGRWIYCTYVQYCMSCMSEWVSV